MYVCIYIFMIFISAILVGKQRSKAAPRILLLEICDSVLLGRSHSCCLKFVTPSSSDTAALL